MTTSRPEARFEAELEAFRKEADEAVQHLYAYLTMHAVAAEDRSLPQLYNTFPLFWLTTLRALQTSTVHGAWKALLSGLRAQSQRPLAVGGG